MQPLLVEPRVVLTARGQPITGRRELTVEEILDETFVRGGNWVDPVWAATWSLDEHRGGPPPRLSVEPALDLQGILATIAAGLAITTAPAFHAAAIVSALPGLVAIPLPDARPIQLSLVGRRDRRGPLVRALSDVAESLAASAPDGASFLSRDT